MTAHAAAPGQAPAREVLVARQPVLDADLDLLGFELLLGGGAAVIDALSEVGLDALTGGYAAWLPLDRECCSRWARRRCARTASSCRSTPARTPIPG